MPSNPIFSFSGDRLDPLYPGDENFQMPVKLKASTTYAKGTVLGELTATPGTYGAYASGNSDGTQTAKAVLPYACVTDASGNITLGDVSGGDDRQHTFTTIPVYYSECQFLTTDLVGLDSTAVGQLGRIVSGVLANGVIRLT